MPLPAEFQMAKILIVDDQTANVLFLEQLLSEEGYANIFATTDSRTVEPLCRANRFDLILLDLDMPHLDGFAVMARLKEIDLDTYLPILVLTAMTDQQTRLRALASGAKDFIAKHPFDHLEAMTRIRNMLEVRLAHNLVRDQNRLLEEKVQERTRELQNTRLEIIHRLGRAIEYHDNDTGLHIVRMSRYCERLARTLGLPGEQCEMLLHTAPMHDIGKVAISDSILLKPGPLDPAEFEIIKTHTTIGAAILAGHPSKLMEMAHDIALTHHEKWDGTGYPNALQGQAIPVEGRIAAVCDVFDALTNDRPYKKCWSNEAAIAHLHASRGKAFDPQIVDAFDAALPAILEIQQTFAEPLGFATPSGQIRQAHIFALGNCPPLGGGEATRQCPQAL